MKAFQFNLGTQAVLYGITALVYLFVFVPLFFVIYASFDPNEIMRRSPLRTSSSAPWSPAGRRLNFTRGEAEFCGPTAIARRSPSNCRPMRLCLARCPRLSSRDSADGRSAH